MDVIIYVFFTLSAVLLAGTVHFFLLAKKPGVYPPRHILKKRAGALGAAGIAILFLSILLNSFR